MKQIQMKRVNWMKRKEKRSEHVRLEKMVVILNKYSLFFHALLACGVCFLIEWLSRHL